MTDETERTGTNWATRWAKVRAGFGAAVAWCQAHPLTTVAVVAGLGGMILGAIAL